MEITTLTHCPHSQKVSAISGLLATYAGLPPDTAELIRQVALYHDIGKSAIDPAILNSWFCQVQTIAFGHEYV